MALTIRQITDEQIELAKNLTGKGAGSAAITACIQLAADYKDRIEIQRNRIAELERRLAHTLQVQEKLASACDEALTIVRQRDWISS